MPTTTRPIVSARTERGCLAMYATTGSGIPSVIFSPMLISVLPHGDDERDQSDGESRDAEHGEAGHRGPRVGCRVGELAGRTVNRVLHPPAERQHDDSRATSCVTLTSRVAQEAG